MRQQRGCWQSFAASGTCAGWHGGPTCVPSGHGGRADMPTQLLAQAQAAIISDPWTAYWGDVAQRVGSNPETLELG